MTARFFHGINIRYSLSSESQSSVLEQQTLEQEGDSDA